MSNEPNVPEAADDFAEFAAPPRQRPRSLDEAARADKRPQRSEQHSVDEVLKRLARERAEGKR